MIITVDTELIKKIGAGASILYGYFRKHTLKENETPKLFKLNGQVYREIAADLNITTTSLKKYVDLMVDLEMLEFFPAKEGKDKFYRVKV